jgi:hypothetical protein
MILRNGSLVGPLKKRWAQTYSTWSRPRARAALLKKFFHTSAKAKVGPESFWLGQSMAAFFL